MTLTGTDPVEYAKSLLAQGKAKEALAVTRPLADAPGASHAGSTRPGPLKRSACAPGGSPPAHPPGTARRAPGPLP